MLYRFVQEIGTRLVVGAGLAVVGVWTLRLSANQGWLPTTWRQRPAVALALITFAAA